jgi:uncharacterized protein
MLNAILIHGLGNTPESFWFPWLKNSLEQRGWRVQAPTMPETNRARLGLWLPFLLENCQLDSETVLIGHSAGCPLILSALERSAAPIKKSVFVAGFASPLGEGRAHPMLPERYDWDKIRAACRSFVMINSDDDPWGCNDQAGLFIFQQLGGTLIVRHGAGHMGSEKFNQPYREFPFLLSVILADDI